MVIIGTPVINKNIAPAVRTYLTNHNLNGKKIGFFCTASRFGMERVFEEMKKLTSKSVIVGNFSTLSREVKSGSYRKKVRSFTERLKKVGGND